MENIRTAVSNAKKNLSPFRKIKGNLSEILVDKVKGRDNTKLEKSMISKNVVKILGSDDAKVSHNRFKEYLAKYKGFEANSYALACMKYYMNFKERRPYEVINPGGLSLTPENIKNIAKTGFLSNLGRGEHCLVINKSKLRDIMHEKGSFYSDVNRLDGIIIQKIKGKEHLPVAEIKKQAYGTIEIKKIFVNKLNPLAADFYFAIGDGNYLFGKATDINKSKQSFRMLYVLYDEYNWDSKPYTYFFKSKGIGTYDLVVETSAFKKWEENKLAAPFLNFIVYTSEEKVYSKTRYLRP